MRRSQPRVLVRVMVGAVVASAVLLAPAAAQGGAPQAHIEPVQGLEFGQLLPGVATQVRPTDVAQRGELQIEGNGQYSVQFILPTVLTTGAGASLPVRFGAGDGAVVLGTAGAPQPFDPHVGFSVLFTRGVRDAQVFLGGTVLPGYDQAAGVYSAEVTILMARN